MLSVVDWTIGACSRIRKTFSRSSRTAPEGHFLSPSLITRLTCWPQRRWPGWAAAGPPYLPWRLCGVIWLIAWLMRRLPTELHNATPATGTMGCLSRRPREQERLLRGGVQRPLLPLTSMCSGPAAGPAGQPHSLLPVNRFPRCERGRGPWQRRPAPGDPGPSQAAFVRPAQPRARKAK